METIIIVVLVVLVLLVLLGRGGSGSLSGLVVNGIIGVVLLFLTNLVLSPPIPINLLTIIICALGGVLGWLIIVILHILGVTIGVG